MTRSIIILFLFPVLLFSQTERNNTSFYIATELQGGKIIPNTSSHPSTNANLGVHLHFGFLSNGNHAWGEFYNYPELGISLGYNSLGNKDIFGSEISLVPFFLIPTSKNPKKGVHFKLGTGITYHTKRYNAENNIDNLYIGSHLNWSANASIYKSFSIRNKYKIKTGITFRHSSNGHTVLPNYGVNSILASVIFQIYPKGISERIAILEKEKKKKEYHYYFIANQGIGFHELGGPTKPIGGKLQMISTSGIFLGVLFKKHILLRGGFSYRYYETYRNYIRENNLLEYSDNPVWSSSSLIFSIGTEFLFGHFSIDIQGGLNIAKPFYKTHFEVFENTSSYDKTTKQYFTTKYGFNVYLFNTKNLPTHNLRLGAFINANFGQADFSEFGLAYVYKI